VGGTYVFDLGASIENFPEPGADLINPVTGQPNSVQQRRPLYSVDPGLTDVYDMRHSGMGDRTITLSSLRSKNVLRKACPFWFPARVQKTSVVAALTRIPTWAWPSLVLRGLMFRSGWFSATSTNCLSAVAGLLAADGTAGRMRRSVAGRYRASAPALTQWYNWRCFVSPPTDVFGNGGFYVLRGQGFVN
jgi:hypothetical protein